MEYGSSLMWLLVIWGLHAQHTATCCWPGGSCVEVAEGEAKSRDTLKSCCFSKQPSLAIRANVGV